MDDAQSLWRIVFARIEGEVGGHERKMVEACAQTPECCRVKPFLPTCRGLDSDDLGMLIVWRNNVTPLTKRGVRERTGLQNSDGSNIFTSSPHQSTVRVPTM